MHELISLNDEVAAYAPKVSLPLNWSVITP